ncbi:MAG: hypothetical protein ABIR37_00970 [Candidatus Saccharimonadales bacterium]
MSRDLEPQVGNQIESMAAAEVPVDVTVHRPVEIGRYGRVALTRTKITLSTRGTAERQDDNPDQVTIDGSVSRTGPTSFRIHLDPSSLNEPIGIEMPEPKQIEGGEK